MSIASGMAFFTGVVLFGMAVAAVGLTMGSAGGVLSRLTEFYKGLEGFFLAATFVLVMSLVLIVASAVMMILWPRFRL